MNSIELKRYSHLSNISDRVFHFSESNTDKTRVVPDIVQTRAILANGLGSSKKQLYDFPNGIDDGSADVAMFARQKWVSRVDLDNAYKSFLHSLTTRYQDDKERLKAEQEKLDEAYKQQQQQLDKSQSDSELKS